MTYLPFYIRDVSVQSVDRIQETEVIDQKLQSVHELSTLEMETSKYLPI